MKKILLFSLILVGTLFASQVMGQKLSPSEFESTVKNELASESCACAAYFAIVAGGLRTRGDSEETAKDYDELFDRALFLTFFFSNEETATSRLKIYTQMLMEDMEYDYANISRLMGEYAEPCKEMIENTETWMDSIAQKVIERQ